MGSFCCASRKEMRMQTTNKGFNSNSMNTSDNKIALKIDDYGTEAITEEYLKNVYSNANRQENLEVLLQLTENKSSLVIDETVLRENWLTKPETLGDVALIQIMNIIQKRVKGLILDEKQMMITKNKEKYKYKIDIIIEKITQTDLINKMITLLYSNSNTKKDVAILILCTLSASKILLGILMNGRFIKILTSHLKKFIKTKNINYKEHVIATLQLFRRVYVKDIGIRKVFIIEGGIEILNELLKTDDVDIVLEVLYNIEDLIFNDEEEYQSYSNLVIKEIIEMLYAYNIERTLYELYQLTKLQKAKYSTVEIEVKRLITVFDGKKSIE